MKKLLSLLLALSLVLACGGYAAAAGHTGEQYLTDTLTLAGSGFDGVRSLTVAVVEALAETELGYENDYSMMTSGGVFTTHRFTGVRLVELLLHEGMDPALPDSTPVKLIAKDGYTIALTLGALRGENRGRYTERGGALAEGGLPALVAFASDGEMLVGPTGTESVYKKFTAAEGYVESADNVGGPLRLVLGQTSAMEFNAPMCAKWLSAVVVGDANGYVYTRETETVAPAEREPEQSGDWTHQGAQADFRLTITGSEAKETCTLSLAELEAMAEGTVRQYFAASAGRNAYEGVTLRRLVERYLADGLDAPTRVTVKSPDGYAKEVDLTQLREGIRSMYQPGETRDVLLAWAVDGAPLVPGADSEGYNGANGFGPLRLVVENTISMWVKSVSEIVLGEEETPAFCDLDGTEPYYASAKGLAQAGLLYGDENGRFMPDDTLTRAQLTALLHRMDGTPAAGKAAFSDVGDGAWYASAVGWAAETGLVSGYPDGRFDPDGAVTREQLAAILFRYAVSRGLDAVTPADYLRAFPDAPAAASDAIPALNWCVGNGLLAARDDGGLHPGDAATRAEAATALWGWLNR